MPIQLTSCLQVDSPIELIMANTLLQTPAFVIGQLRLHTQVPAVSKDPNNYFNYRVDFLITDAYNNNLVVVECDGKKYHQHNQNSTNNQDSKRDQAILQTFGVRTLRFSGTNIYRFNLMCAQAILEYIFYGKEPHPDFKKHRDKLNF